MEQVRARTDIVEVVSNYVLLKKTGGNYLGLCPFHSEKTPSFSVSPTKQIFYCFGCHEGGDVFTFLMKKEGMGFREALEHLAEAVGVEVPQAEDPQSRLKASVFEALEMAAAFYRVEMEGPRGARARTYLEKRGLEASTVRDFGVGYAPDEWDALLKGLKKKRVSREILGKAGLVTLKESGGAYDKFRNRVMFPIRDVTGRVVGFGGRALDEDGPKYLNSPESLVFHKGRCLYGLHLARESIRRTGRAVVVEGYMDAVSAHQSGVDNVVASLGTSLTAEQARLVLRYAPEAVMAYDADAAGEAATLRGLEVFSAAGCRVKVAVLPEGKDPDDIVRQGGKRALEALLTEALPLVEYRLSVAMRGVDTGTVEGKVRVSTEMIPVLSRIRNAVERTSYIRMVSSRLGIEEKALVAEVDKARSPQHKKSPGRHNRVDNAEAGKDNKGSMLERAEMGLVRLMIQHPEVIQRVRDGLGESFENPRCLEIASALFRMERENRKVSPPALLDVLSDEAGMIVTRISMDPVEYDDPRKAVEDCLRTLERTMAARRLSEIEMAIGESKAQGELPDATLLEEYLKIVRGIKGSAKLG